MSELKTVTRKGWNEAEYTNVKGVLSWMYGVGKYKEKSSAGIYMPDEVMKTIGLLESDVANFTKCEFAGVSKICNVSSLIVKSIVIFSLIFNEKVRLSIKRSSLLSWKQTNATS